MNPQLKRFEKFLSGYKTYLVAVAAILYGVVEQGYALHHWTSPAGAWTWVISAAGVAALRAALASYATQLIVGVKNPPTVVVQAPSTTTLPNPGP